MKSMAEIIMNSLPFARVPLVYGGMPPQPMTLYLPVCKLHARNTKVVEQVYANLTCKLTTLATAVWAVNIRTRYCAKTISQFQKLRRVLLLLCFGCPYQRLVSFHGDYATHNLVWGAHQSTKPHLSVFCTSKAKRKTTLRTYLSIELSNLSNQNTVYNWLIRHSRKGLSIWNRLWYQIGQVPKKPKNVEAFETVSASK